MGNFLYLVVDGVLGLLILAIIISAILSWLVAFEIINLRNQFVYGVYHFLEAVTRPVLAPVQKIIPPLGGVDISPIIVILVLGAVRQALLPWIFAPIITALGG